MRELKQVIVMRKDLNMRKGKMVAQGAHASVLAVIDLMEANTLAMVEIVNNWADSGMTKICVGVNSEDELLKLYTTAFKAKIPVYIVKDAGRTEFDNIPTHTCIAIGPWYSDEIDKITGELKLL